MNLAGVAIVEMDGQETARAYRYQRRRWANTLRRSKIGVTRTSIF